MRDAITRISIADHQDERVALLSPQRWCSRSFLQLPASIGDGTPAAAATPYQQQLNQLTADWTNFAGVLVRMSAEAVERPQRLEENIAVAASNRFTKYAVAFAAAAAGVNSGRCTVTEGQRIITDALPESFWKD
jgi:hypothetical protein